MIIVHHTQCKVNEQIRTVGKDIDNALMRLGLRVPAQLYGSPPIIQSSTLGCTRGSDRTSAFSFR